MTATIPTPYGDLIYWTTSDPQSLPVASSAMMTSVANALEEVWGSDWMSYTPALTADTSNPTLGTGGSAVGRYKKLGKLVVVLFTITFGSSMSPGSGVYSVSLPVAANVVLAPTSGGARGFDSSTGNAHLGLRVSVNSGSTLGFQYTASFGGTLGNVSHSAPWTWAAGDILDGFLIYEAAS